MIRLEKARRRDAKVLAKVSEEAFHEDVNYGAPGPGRPPGYASEEFQVRMMRFGDYYKITQGEQIVGGLLVHPQKPRHYELGRIFIAPGHQNQGIGSRVIEMMEQAYPLAKRWTLDTPKWNLRTQHFYEKMGYRQCAGQISDDEARLCGATGTTDLVLYEKAASPRS